MALLSLAVHLLVPHPTDEAACPPFSLLPVPTAGVASGCCAQPYSPVPCPI